MKPSVAYASEVAARNNLLVKQRVFSRLLKSGAKDQIELTPKSLSKFNAWSSDGSHDLIPEVFSRNALVTLSRDLGIRGAIETLCQARWEALNPQRTKPERLSRLRSNNRLLHLLRQIAESEVMASRKKILQLESKLVVMQSKFKSLETASVEKLRRLESEVQELRDLNARLVSERRKIRPLKDQQ